MGITTGAQGLTVIRRALRVRPVATLPLFTPVLPFRRRIVEAGCACSSVRPSLRRCSPAPIGLLPYQNTRFQTRIAEFGARLSEWSLNPWRKLSLLALTFLFFFFSGVGLGSIIGALSLMDLVAAVLCVLTLELGVRARGVLRRGGGDRLAMHLVDMARMGLLYGLLLEGFKLL
jgi:hypothetical protein